MRSGERVRRRSAQGGFTLLEMMIAMCILAMSLVWIIEATTRAIAAENHAKMTTAATFLARQKLVELEDDMQEKGITNAAFTDEEKGDFKDDGFKRFKWSRKVEKIELPNTEAIQTAMSAFGGDSSSTGGGSGSTAGGLSSMGSGGNSASNNMLSSQFGLIKNVLEQGIRMARVRVSWTEMGQERHVEVSEFLTDPRAVDQSVAIPPVPVQ